MKINKKKLYIDMIPKTSWYQNLRSILNEKEWEMVRKDVYKKNNFKCEICGGKGDKHPVEAHERWDYNKETKIQTLLNIEALCPKCHMVTHIGLAEISNKMLEATEHLKKVNNWSDEEVFYELKRASLYWKELNEINWNVNVEWLLDKFEFSKETMEKLKFKENL